MFQRGCVAARLQRALPRLPSAGLPSSPLSASAALQVQCTIDEDECGPTACSGAMCIDVASPIRAMHDALTLDEGAACRVHAAGILGCLSWLPRHCPHKCWNGQQRPPPMCHRLALPHPPPRQLDALHA